jgi:hypothetical protein
MDVICSLWPNILSHPSAQAAAVRQHAVELLERARQPRRIIEGPSAPWDCRLNIAQPATRAKSLDDLTSEVLDAISLLEQAEARQVDDLAQTRERLDELRDLLAQCQAAGVPATFIRPPARPM